MVQFHFMHAGRKLIGKPFVTKNNQIYCGDQVKLNTSIISVKCILLSSSQCKEYYKQNASAVSVLSNDNKRSEVG